LDSYEGTMADRLASDVHSGPAWIGDFGGWMAAEQQRVFLICRRLLQDSDEADSATQDVFFKAYRALNKRNGELHSHLNEPRKWVTRIAINTCLDRLRSKSWKMWRRRPLPEDEEIILERAPGGEPDAERLLLSKQIARRLELALGKLSSQQRAVFSLRHYEAMPLEEIAALLDLDIGTVKSHLFRAITKMRKELLDLYRSGTSDQARKTRKEEGWV
jgi:RNA polymerase sigma-70 factor (ECF subfamily)